MRFYAEPIPPKGNTWGIYDKTEPAMCLAVTYGQQNADMIVTALNYYDLQVSKPNLKRQKAKRRPTKRG